MPYPATGTERPRPDLAETLFDFDYGMNQQNFVALDIFPLREVDYFKGDFPRVTFKQMMKKSSLVTAKPPGFAFERAPRSAYPTEDTSFGKDSYETREFGLQGIVDEWESHAYADYLEHEMFVTEFVNNQLLEQMEIRVESQVFDAVAYTTANGMATNVGGGGTLPNAGGAVAVPWDTYATANPVAQVRNAKFAIYLRTGKWPNAIVMNKFAWEHLIETDDIRSRVHSQGAGSEDRRDKITKGIIAEILGLDEVVVAEGTHDSANPGSSAAPSQIWGPHASLFIKPKTRNLREVCTGRTFHWALDSSMPRGFVESYYDDDVRADKIRVRHQLENKRVYTETAQLLLNVY